MTERFKPESRDCFPYLDEVTTRWGDNDVYGHVNNVVYYAWFDSVVNRMLIERGLAPGRVDDPAAAGLPIGLVVATKCQYFESVAYPGKVEIGLRVESTGNTSVTYRLGVFTPEAHQRVFESLRRGDST
jgi:acyl-CoA thioester hydrolase